MSQDIKGWFIHNPQEKIKQQQHCTSITLDKPIINTYDISWLYFLKNFFSLNYIFSHGFSIINHAATGVRPVMVYSPHTTYIVAYVSGDIP